MVATIQSVRSFRSYMRRALLAAFLLTGFLCSCGASATQRFGLIVGVSGYEEPLTPLQGPKNDVTLLVNTLIESNWTRRDRIRVLADDLEHSYYAAKVITDAMPTIAEIRKGFDWLVNAAGTGDEVIVYLAGHGSYVPARGMPSDAAESDGVDEIFLPLDIGGWSDTLHGLKNQLIDNEISVLLSKVQGKGATVWLIADSCNAGTLSRAGVTVRGANPVSQLGVPSKAFQRLSASPTMIVRNLASSGLTKGSFVGFYAAQPSLDAVEVQVPLAGDQAELRIHGLFTWYLVRAIRSGQTANFERIAQTIIAGYSDWQSAAPVPMFEGELHLKSGFPAQGGRLYSIAKAGDQITVKAGVLDGIDVGTRFDLIDLRGDAPKKIGSGHATKSAPDHTLIEVDQAEQQANRHVIDELRTQPSRFGAQVTSLGVSLQLSVALDPLSNGAKSVDQRAHDQAVTAMAALFADPSSNQMIALISAPPPARPDVRLIIKHGRLWFAPPTGDIVDSNGAVPQFLEAKMINRTNLEKRLAQIGHARNLMRAANILQTTQTSRNAQVKIFRKAQARTKGHCPVHVEGRTQAAGLVVFDSQTAQHQTVRFVDCDLVTITLNNRGSKSMSVTPLYVDAWSYISFLYDYEGSSNSGLIIDPGQAGQVSYTDELPTGAESKRSGRAKLVLLITEVDGSEPTAPDYRSLATNALQPLRADAVDSSSPDFLVTAAGSGAGDLRSATDTSSAQMGAVILPIDVARKP
jgi:hypothetical protein